MFFTRFYDKDLAQASYMVGCQKTGECLVVDGIRDVSQYLAEAESQGLSITHVAETHIHADYLSGSRELAQRTGATMLLSDEGGEDWSYGFEHEGLHDGDEFRVGNIRIKALHTPGHTPEHLSYLVTDTPRGEDPVILLSGDFVFVGDLGRPDLLDEAAGFSDTRFIGAKQQFSSLRDKFLPLPDGVQVWPAHGAGSACGKALGAVPSSTVGYERAVAWWAPFLASGDEQGFVDELLSGQPDAPLYYGRMKRENRDGPAVLGEPSDIPQLSADDVAGLRLIDTRSATEHHAARPENSINIPDGGTFETWSGWLIDPHAADYALIAEEDRAQPLRKRLWMVGIDNVRGWLPGVEGLKTSEFPPIPADSDLSGAYVLDVRAKTEYAEGHIPEAHQLHAGRLPWRLNEIPRDADVVVHCQSGMRSAAAASLLRTEGFTNLSELEGGYLAWSHAQGQ